MFQHRQRFLRRFSRTSSPALSHAHELHGSLHTPPLKDCAEHRSSRRSIAIRYRQDDTLPRRLCISGHPGCTTRAWQWCQIRERIHYCGCYSGGDRTAQMSVCCLSAQTLAASASPKRTRRATPPWSAPRIELFTAPHPRKSIWKTFRRASSITRDGWNLPSWWNTSGKAF